MAQFVPEMLENTTLELEQKKQVAAFMMHQGQSQDDIIHLCVQIQLPMCLPNPIHIRISVLQCFSRAR